MFIHHRKHRTQWPVTDIGLLSYMQMVYAPHRKHKCEPTGIALHLAEILARGPAHRNSILQMQK
jgi:hypothetical protein